MDPGDGAGGSITPGLVIRRVDHPRLDGAVLGVDLQQAGGIVRDVVIALEKLIDRVPLGACVRPIPVSCGTTAVKRKFDENVGGTLVCKTDG